MSCSHSSNYALIKKLLNKSDKYINGVHKNKSWCVVGISSRIVLQIDKIQNLKEFINDNKNKLNKQKHPINKNDEIYLGILMKKDLNKYHLEINNKFDLLLKLFDNDLKNKYVRLSSNKNDNFSNIIKPQNNNRINPDGHWFGYGSEWVQYLVNDISKNNYMCHDYVYVVDIKAHKRLKIMKTPEQVKKFTKKYINKKTTNVNKIIDYDKVKQDYDGLIIHFPDNMFNEHVQIYDKNCIKEKDSDECKELNSWIFSWDASSGVIWDNTNLKIPLKLYAYWDDKKKVYVRL
jgi:hypothetical protein